jgi:hypothetical protein
MGSSGEAATLAEFVAANPPRGNSGSGCTVCSLEQRDQIDTFYRQQGARHAIISKWLRSQGLNVTPANLGYHYAAGHHDHD